MVVHFTCKNEEESIKNEGARVSTELYVLFFRRSREVYSEISGGILPKIDFGPIRPGTAELAALEHLKRFPLTYNGKVWLAP